MNEKVDAQLVIDDAAELSDERLCWLLAREELNRGGGSRWRSALRFLLVANGSRGRAADLDERRSGRMANYALAVDDAAERLSAEERRTLRAERTLPEWFMADVERRYREIRKQG